MIYFLHHGSTGLIKVGVTGHLPRRLKWFRGRWGESLSVIGVTPGRKADEQALHRHIRACRAEGEWYWPRRPLCGFIRHFASRWDGRPDLIDEVRPSGEMTTWGRILADMPPAWVPPHRRPPPLPDRSPSGYPRLTEVEFRLAMLGRDIPRALGRTRSSHRQPSFS